MTFTFYDSKLNVRIFLRITYVCHEKERDDPSAKVLLETNDVICEYWCYLSVPVNIDLQIHVWIRLSYAVVEFNFYFFIFFFLLLIYLKSLFMCIFIKAGMLVGI